MAAVENHFKLAIPGADRMSDDKIALGRMPFENECAVNLFTGKKK